MLPLFYLLSLATIQAEGSKLNTGPSYSVPIKQYTATPYITYSNSKFGADIEGASVDKHGTVYGTNYGSTKASYQIGQVYPEQKLIYKDKLTNSFFNGIRVYKDQMFITDTKNHRVVRLVANKDVYIGDEVCKNDAMIQPNDIAISKNGVIYLSGGNYTFTNDFKSGDVWRCDINSKYGNPMERIDLLGRTNGITLTNDESHLLVSESLTREGTPYLQKIWKYKLNEKKVDQIVNSKSLFVDFELLDNSQANDIDGFRFDIEGNLFVTKYSGRKVTIFNNQGKHIGEIKTNFKNPTNLEFGGKHGTTLFIFGKCTDVEDSVKQKDYKGNLIEKGCVDTLEWSSKGTAFDNLNK